MVLAVVVLGSLDSASSMSLLPGFEDVIAGLFSNLLCISTQQGYIRFLPDNMLQARVCIMLSHMQSQTASPLSPDPPLGLGQQGHQLSHV